eukprot:gene9133-biopygen1135
MQHEPKSAKNADAKAAAAIKNPKWNKKKEQEEGTRRRNKKKEQGQPAREMRPQRHQHHQHAGQSGIQKLRSLVFRGYLRNKHHSVEH